MKTPVKREKGRVDLFGERFRARAHQLSPRLLAVVSYINENREVVLERTAMEIAAATQTSDATVVRAIQALGFAGLRELKQTMERWFGPSITSSEKMLSTVNALSCDVNSSIDFVLEGHQRACEVLSRPTNRAAVAQAVALLSEARQVAIFGIGASGILAEYTGRLFSRIGLPSSVLNRTGFSLAVDDVQHPCGQRGIGQLHHAQRALHLVQVAGADAHAAGITRVFRVVLDLVAHLAQQCMLVLLAGHVAVGAPVVAQLRLPLVAGAGGELYQRSGLLLVGFEHGCFLGA